MKYNTYDTIIVGGGAAGMAAGIFSLRKGLKTCIIEKNDILGKKLRITGKGRCNVTNDSDANTYHEHIIDGSRFMMSSYSKFDSRDTMKMFEELGVPLKTERGNRVFPVSDNANDVANALISELKRLKCDFITGTVNNVITENNTAVGVVCDDKSIYGNRIIIATGGKSYPRTGSTGDGYNFARETGHRVTELKPCLVPLEVNERELCKSLRGITLKNVSVRFYENKKRVFDELGEMSFLSDCVTGALVLKASAYIKDFKKYNYKLIIDLKPALDEGKLDRRIQRDIAENPKRLTENAMRRLLPEQMIKPILKLAEIGGEKQAAQITKAERRRLVETLKNLTFTVKNFGPWSEAVITAGGVDTRDINPKNMESKIVKNLYFIGEVLDVHGFTGGYNLQTAFSTANAVFN